MRKSLHTIANTIREYTHYVRALFLIAFLASTFQIAFAADIILSPSSGSHTVGETFSVDVLVTHNQDPINGVSASLNFSQDTLELRSISKSGSIITVWAEDPSYSNGAGTASLEGVILNPGFSGTQGKVVTLSFRVKKAGTGNVILINGSVLANDGNATNVLGSLGSASYTLTDDTADQQSVADTVVTQPIAARATGEPAITSSTHPDQNAWYNLSEASFDWKLTSGVNAVRTLYNQTPFSVPNKVYDPPIANRSIQIDGDGVMYMHVQFRVGSTWGPVAHYKFNVDRKAPQGLKVTFPDGNVTSNPTPAALVLVDDADSGVARITMSVDGGNPISYSVDPSHVYHLPKSSPGNHTVTITAFDHANNSSSASIDYTIQAIAVPTITEYTKNLELGNKFRVSGTTYPQTTVEVALTDRDGKISSESTTSDSNGIFTLDWSKDIDAGVYEMRARAVDSKGATSEYTDGKAIVVEHMALIRIGLFIMNWLSLALIIVLASALVAATFWYSFLQFTRFRRRIHRTMQEAEHALKTNVQALRRDTEEFHGLLIKAEKKRDLTKEERSILKKFKKRLDFTETEIEEKLKQIG